MHHAKGSPSGLDTWCPQTTLCSVLPLLLINWVAITYSKLLSEGGLVPCQAGSHDFYPWLDRYIATPAPLPAEHSPIPCINNHAATLSIWLFPYMSRYPFRCWLDGWPEVWLEWATLRLPVSWFTNWAELPYDKRILLATLHCALLLGLTWQLPLTIHSLVKHFTKIWCIENTQLKFLQVLLPSLATNSKCNYQGNQNDINPSDPSE